MLVESIKSKAESYSIGFGVYLSDCLKKISKDKYCYFGLIFKQF